MRVACIGFINACLAMAVSGIGRMPHAEILVDVLPEWRDRFERIAGKRQIEVAKPHRALQRNFQKHKRNGDHKQPFAGLLDHHKH